MKLIELLFLMPRILYNNLKINRQIKNHFKCFDFNKKIMDLLLDLSEDIKVDNLYFNTLNKIKEIWWSFISYVI